MADNTKEWVTVKVPKDVRDRARDDPRTYGEIMAAGLTPEGAQPELREAAELPKHIAEQLDRIEASSQTAEERTGAIQRQLEDLSR